ncbi:SEC-C metal-binding domain-containing protein [Sphingomonas sanguinis]|uniref:SEC-C metal-binding domain-containing protein n=1 Tax=Sphingomonas sanguinis TaxID=33051 RepID=A0ABU5LM97_9SPHN|nr:SEC-C metal-binding domain-containing protein [Sphingomonas sanguinis]MDZ7281048.1 SEC-C metal-binding domain-containing protein [Sphingomonas sanguinis]
MGRNEPCWCGSNNKWKKCHMGREAMKPFSPFEVEADWRRRGQKGYCSHSLDGTGCANGIVKSHTVQRRGGLSAIAEGKSLVMTVKPQSMRAMIDHEGRPPPIEIGIGKASVFPGFCGHHDDAIFKPVEGKDVALDAGDAMLFAYRAMAYERFTKAVHVENTMVQRQMDRGQPLPIQQAIQRQCHITLAGAKRSLAEIDTVMKEYRARLDGGSHAGFHHRAYRFDGLLPLVAAGAFMPELAIDGTLLQRLARGTAAFEQLTLTISSYAGRSVAVFGWIGPDDGASAAYVDAFDAVPDADKADAIMQIAFEQLENIYLRPSWWNGLPTPQRAHLRERVYAGVATKRRTPGGCSPSKPPLATAGIVESTRS